jgi:hypothetical protein
MIGDYIIDAFQSFFQNPSAWGIGLAIAFGAVWLAAYRPSLFEKPGLWAVLVGSAFLTLAAVCFVQVPLQVWTGQALNHFWSEEVLTRWILLAAIPSVLLTGLVQEGAKLVPVVVYWRSGENIEAKLGLTIGAIAGAGFGIFQAQQALNAQFATGMITWDVMKTFGFMSLIYTGFWHTFFIVAAQIAFSALAGYGLAKGWGWQFYLIASVLHGLLSYANVLYSAEVLTDIQTVIYITVLAVLVTAGALWLRWRKTTVTAELAIASPEVMTAETELPPGESSNQM